MAGPITVSIARRVADERSSEMYAWLQAGIALANSSPGFLGAGWVRPSPTSQTWHLLYRFEDAATLERWDTSPERAWWLHAGSPFVEETHVQHRTGIEGWFDTPGEGDGTTPAAPNIPPRWRQALAIFCVFFPLSLAANWVTRALLPEWVLPARVLVACLLVTPVMVYVALPWITAKLAWFLHGRPPPWRARDT